MAQPAVRVRQIPQASRERVRDPFSLVVAVAALAAAGNASPLKVLDPSSDFILHKLTYMADVAGAAQTESARIIPLVTLLITDSSNQRPLMEEPIPIPALFGPGQLPFILSQPKRFRAGTSLTFLFNNYSAATTYRLYLVLSGVKEWL